MAKSEKVVVRVPQEDGEVVLSRGTNNQKRHYVVVDHLVEVDEADLAHLLAGVEGAHKAPKSAVRETKAAPSKPDSPESKDGQLNNGSNSRDGDSERL